MMSERTLDLWQNVTVTLPPGAKVVSSAPGAQQVVWTSAGESRTFTVTFTPSGRAVTQWFRRADSWPLLLNKLGTAEGVPHVYVGGVATGEEAYSLAMLLEANSIEARITASDFNPEILAIARSARYSRESVEQALTSGVLSPEAIARYLHREGDGYRVVDAVRERVTFEVSDLRDATLPDSEVFMLRNLWRHLGTSGAAHLAHAVARALPQFGVLSIGGADGLTDIEDRAGLDALLRMAALMPVGVHDLYFRT